MDKCIELFSVEGKKCFVIRQFLSEKMVKQFLIDKNFSKAIMHYPSYYRNNERFLEDNRKLSEYLFKKSRQFLPNEIVDRNDGSVWRISGINERVRFCRYLPGQFFGRHLDGVYHVSDKIKSKLTFMIYLSDPNSYEGGDTIFYASRNGDILHRFRPDKGDLIVFHHDLWHEGERVISGEKYILRSDIIYEKVGGKEKEVSGRYEPCHLGYIWKLLKFNDDTIISAGRDKCIRVWDVNSGYLKQKIQQHENSILCIDKIDENHIISGARDGTIKIWKRVNNKFELDKTITTEAHTVLDLLKIDEKTFVCTTSNFDIQLYSTKGELIYKLVGHKDWVWKVIRIDENTLISCSQDGSLKMWDLMAYKEIATLNENKSPLTSVLNIDDKIYAGDQYGVLNIWQFDKKGKWSYIQSYKVHDDVIRDLLCIENSKLITASEDNKIRVWSLHNMELLNEFKHQDFVQSIVYDKKNKVVISGSYEGKMQEWKIEN
ncbi:hypothetical protein GWK08_13055 [Leptobacterium flavescens]|uniref:Fe2OG dioxygenase domain-containing protein n=1 Tax=Leptobacterium flavescens TaxID=472055 RepID=A0A6P0UMD8_9FLAO|nr:2OG-Fe(II) oxygenase [Leptobacterium flavescens]NER14375.1 hypothetical protein [Leptobacterium flavescens]